MTLTASAREPLHFESELIDGKIYVSEGADPMRRVFAFHQFVLASCCCSRKCSYSCSYTYCYSLCDDEPPADDPICFSGESTVEVRGQGLVPMSELKIGDYVMASNGMFSQVYGFGHKARSFKTKYLQVFTESMHKEHPLEISAEHLIYTHDTSKNTSMLVAAGDLRVGDSLLTALGSPSTILWIRVVERQGVYSPLTVSGSLLVNGILVSSYVSRSWLKDRVSGDTLHKLQHGAMSPVRLLCTFFTSCKTESYNETTGFSGWVQFWFNVEQWMLTLPLAWRACLLVLLMAPASLMTLLGTALVMPVNSLVAHTVAAAAVVVGFVLWKYKNPQVAESDVIGPGAEASKACIT